MEDQRTIITSRPDGPVYCIYSLSSREESLHGPQSTKCDDEGSYVTIQRLITASPQEDAVPESEIETVLEAFVSNKGECLWRRVVVWSGPTSPQRVIHASFVLPTINEESAFVGLEFADHTTSLLERPSLLCWAAFPESPKHKLLCVLAGPSMLTIWDVYPDSEEVCVNGGEGHSISLPFKCSSVHPLGVRNGLLLQRKEDSDDLVFFHDVDMGKGRPSEEDSGFVLHTSSQTPSSNRHAPLLPTPPAACTNTATEVPSLFTLQHPLEDVLPVSLWSESSLLVTDVFEKVLRLETLLWQGASGNTKSQQTIIVTYNTHRKRHAMWALKESPVPATETLLWRRSRDRTTVSTWDNHIGMMEQGLEEMHLLGLDQTQDGPTRDEALADALGLRRTPRKSGETMQIRGRVLEPRSSLGRAESAVANSSVLHTSTRSAPKDSFMDSDASLAESTALLNLRPPSSLRPTVAIDCLYEEVRESASAVNVFLASNLEGSGLLVLALVLPSPVDSHNPNLMRLYSFLPSLDNPERVGHRYEVSILSTIPCVDAQPVQTAVGSTPCCRSITRSKASEPSMQATDILVLMRTFGGRSFMGLYRAHFHIVECALLEKDKEGARRMSSITGISNPVRGSLDFINQRQGKGRSVIRGCISLQLDSNALAEKVLASIESAMFQKFMADSDTSAIQFALKFRSDCCRLDQRENAPPQLGENDNWLIVARPLHSLFDFEYYGSVPGSNSESELVEDPDSHHKSPWTQLLNSPYHSSFTQGDFGADVPSCLQTPSCAKSSNDESRSLPASFELTSLVCLKPGTSVAPYIFDAIHFLYEDLKLLSPDPRRIDELRCIGALLVTICSKLELVFESSVLQNFLNHYRNDLGEDFVSQVLSSPGAERIGDHLAEGAPSKPTSFDAPPCILSWLDAKVRNETDHRSIYSRFDPACFNRACAKTGLLLRIFNVMFGDNTSDLKVVSALREEGFLSAEQIRDELPTGAAIPILEVLHRCGDALGQVDVLGWGAVEYNLIRRSDLGHHHGFVPTESFNRNANKTNATTNVPLINDPDEDGIPPLQISSSVLFPQDNRIREAGRLLRSSRPCPLSVPRGVEVSDHEYERLKQVKLLLLCRRALAMPIGRGMLTIGNFKSASAEPLPVPELCLAGRVAPTNANLALDVSDCQNGFLNWPEFHNGVAAGLRLPLEGETGQSVPKITRSWIVYNRPLNSDAQSQQQTHGQRPNWRIKIHAHGGLLLALGLRGYLSALEMTDLYDYLTQGQVTLTCGVLLGMAANKRGSCDISVSKMLCLHLPSLMPQQFSAIDVASAVQTAAVSGTGLLFQGSSSRLMTEFLLNEIGRRPDSDVMLDREAYTLSCGIALGMINICKGDRIGNRIGKGQDGEGEGLADLRVGERLCRYVSNGIDEGESNRNRETTDRLNAALVSGEQERCCCIFEGATINVDVTAAGSTLALGLVYMKTG
jgi:Anaphase-promoting complex subunit 1